MLLARIAQTVYWLGRYLERAEDTARLILGFEAMALDIPQELSPSFDGLLEFCGTECRERYHASGRPLEAAPVYHYMLCDPENENSVLCALGAAREDLRASRAVAPRKTWEVLNELYLDLEREAAEPPSRPALLARTEQVVAQCQRLAGIANSEWSTDATYLFTQIGIHLERADMMARSVGFHIESLETTVFDGPTFSDVRWLNALRSLSAHQMYRRKHHSQANGALSLGFLISDDHFPRSVLSCFRRLADNVARLPNHQHLLHACNRAVSELYEEAPGPHSVVDVPPLLERALEHTAQIDSRLAQTYFN